MMAKGSEESGLGPHEGTKGNREREIQDKSKTKHLEAETVSDRVLYLLRTIENGGGNRKAGKEAPQDVISTRASSVAPQPLDPYGPRS